MKITTHPKIDLQLTFTVNESEARALDALAGYGDDAFIKVFYEHLGKSYMQDYEKGLREFLQTCRTTIPPILSKLKDAHQSFGPYR